MKSQKKIASFEENEFHSKKSEKTKMRMREMMNYLEKFINSDEINLKFFDSYGNYYFVRKEPSLKNRKKNVFKIFESFGIILLTNNENKNEKYNCEVFMVKKNHTFEFSRLCRMPNISIDDIDFDEMTKNEKNYLQNNDINNIKKYFGNEQSFKMTSENLVMLRTNPKFELKINESKDYPENSLWEIPKGRKRENETDIETAIREFQEETKIKKEQIVLLAKSDEKKEKSEIIITEISITDSGTYVMTYFLAIEKSFYKSYGINANKINKNRYLINSKITENIGNDRKIEVSKAGWVPFSELKEMCRSENLYDAIDHSIKIFKRYLLKVEKIKEKSREIQILGIVDPNNSRSDVNGKDPPIFENDENKDDEKY